MAKSWYRISAPTARLKEHAARTGHSTLAVRGGANDQLTNAGTVVRPHLRATLAGNDSEAVVLDLVPLAAGSRVCRFCWGRHGAMNPPAKYAATFGNK